MTGTLLHQAAQKAVETIGALLRHYVPGGGRNDKDVGLAALATLESALQQQPEPVAADRDLHSHMMIVATRAAEGRAGKLVLREVCRAIAADKNLRAKLAAPPALQHQEVPREPVAWRYRYSPKQDWKLTSQPTTQWAADHSGFEEEPLYASPSTTRQQEAGSEWRPIESAPKGRTVLAGYFNRCGKWRTVRAHYYLPQTLELSDEYNGDDEGDGFAPEGWYEEIDASETINFTEEPPTHWMPLPAAPSTPENAGGVPVPDGGQQ